jgi:anti-sigma B factor antagonist
MTAQLDITVNDHPAVTVVAVAGELDIATGGQLRGMLRQLISDGRTRLVVDASDLRFCDSTGLEVLLDGLGDSERAGGTLRLKGVHGTLAVVLDATGLREAFGAEEAPVPEARIAQPHRADVMVANSRGAHGTSAHGIETRMANIRIIDGPARQTPAVETVARR